MFQAQSAQNYNPMDFNFMSMHNRQQYASVLYVFSPKHIPNQVIRPYTYNFNNALIEELTRDGNMREACGPRGTNRSNIQLAIMPESNGIPLNTRTFNEYWSFVMIIDKAPSTSYTTGSVPGPGQRFIATGYFIGEGPISNLSMYDTSPALNPNAIMAFTHTSLIYNNPRVINPMYGSQSPVSVNTDMDNVSQLSGMMSNQDLYLLDPGNVRTYTQQMSPTERVQITPGQGAVSGLGNASTPIPSRLKSPKHHLKEIVDTIDSALAAEAKATVSSTISDTGSYYSDPHTTFLNNFDQKIQSTRKFNPMGIQTEKPLSLGELDLMYPEMRFIPRITPNISQWEVRPQDIMSQSVTFSSMVASTINTLAMNSNLAEISFQYNSWESGGALSCSEGTWRVLRAGVLVGDDNAVVHAFETFKGFMTTDLFPILRAVGGEFEMQIQYDTASETLVDLHFLDDFRQETGFVEIPNRLAGLMTPIIGAINNAEHNAKELQCLLDNCSIKSFGEDAFRLQNQSPFQPAAQVVPSMFDNLNTGGMPSIFN